ncbi:hypothetical protein EVAR_94551_1 [Eumeta japonica]|uniref:Uncharacterized protein n=1 Tax=Eumeta variegata TaxID=151549 RepID=A0A4C1UW73_EUMVA|nr:hypothetical protein EVAR_94551_1 [Eumeta japonica]
MTCNKESWKTVRTSCEKNYVAKGNGGRKREDRSLPLKEIRLQRTGLRKCVRTTPAPLSLNLCPRAVDLRKSAIRPRARDDRRKEIFSRKSYEKPSGLNRKI